MSSFTNIHGGYVTPNGNVIMSDGRNGVITPNGNVIIHNPYIPVSTQSSNSSSSALWKALEDIKQKERNK